MRAPDLCVLELDDLRLRTATWGTGPPDIVLLHQGLGSIPQWRDVPAVVAERTSRTVMAYERSGHGESLPIPSGPWPIDWMHSEALVLGRILEAVGSTRPLIVGHSDGGSSALLYGAQPRCNAAALLSLAAHTWREDLCLDGVVAMRNNRAAIELGLARYHRAPHELFEAWSAVWASDAFADWDIRPELGQITVPTLVAQGANDPYATDAQAHLTAAAIGDNASSMIVPELGHIMHDDDPDAVVQLIVDFFTTHVAPIR